MKKLFLIIISIVITIILLLALFNKGELVNVIEVEKGLSVGTFKEEGEVVMKETFGIYSENSGFVKELFVKEGDYVNNGDVIVILDTTDIEFEIKNLKSNLDLYNLKISEAITKDVESKSDLKNSLEILKSELGSLEASQKIDQSLNTPNYFLENDTDILDISIKNLTVELDDLKDSYENNKILFENGVISKKNLNDIENSITIKENQLKDLEYRKSMLSNFYFGIQSEYGSDYNPKDLKEEGLSERYHYLKEVINSEITLINEKLNRDNVTFKINEYENLIDITMKNIEYLEEQLSKSTIVSNVSGKIINLPVENTSNIFQRDLIASIQINNYDQIETYISTQDILSIKENDSVTIVQKSIAGDMEYPGKIVEIETWASKKTSPLGYEESKVKVYVEPLQSIDTLKGGYYVDLIFTSYELEDSIVIPNTAFFKYNDEDYVYVVNNNKVESRKVKKIKTNSFESTVIEGLDNNDIIIENVSIDNLYEGMKVYY